jgi:hypothetical protein
MPKNSQSATLPATEEHADYDTGSTSFEPLHDQPPATIEQLKDEISLQMDSKLELLQAQLLTQNSEMLSMRSHQSTMF